MATINVDMIAKEIMQSLESYRDMTFQDIEYAVYLVARETVAELNETSPVGATGNYAESWASRKNPKGGIYFNGMVVYSRKPDYRKAHLLEFGHEAVDGSFVNPRPHIKAAEKKAGDWIDIQLNKRIRG